ncbi:MAG: methylated-DNA--[protein]-cysteine S-methyltransferase [Deltaproteobacteria bacterium]|nr:methylated-DNA--[protein]-cysteine S-methyltransferase [Deltaproteobacteria bacterium]MBW2698839.1 methylated-DNA--[protein]-cysteine S-methyltransferase [Deltaproteobacteria bacterium]
MTRIHTARFDSSIGTLTVASSELGLAYVALPRANGRGLAGWQQRHAADAKLAKGYEPNREAIGQILEFLAGKRQAFDLRLDLRGTPFQVDVYAEVAAIPYGESCSYADVAQKLGRPTAVRAVGAANGANPIPLVIPCHRVVAKSGQLQGYAGGLELKAKLLAMESNAQPGQGSLF